MKLYLVQHAKAASKEIDPERPLTAEGKQDIRKVATFIKTLNTTVDYFWHSGKKRAVQTAEILAEVVKVNSGLTQHTGLEPNDDITVIKNELTAAQYDIMIVGHLPFLAKLTSLLLTGSESSNTVVFRKAGIVCLTRDEQNQWQLDWVVIPEILT